MQTLSNSEAAIQAISRIKPYKMPAPSQLKIATSAVNRLVKEEKSYHKELEQQRARLEKLEKNGGDENAEYEANQLVCELCST